MTTNYVLQILIWSIIIIVICSIGLANIMVIALLNFRKLIIICKYTLYFTTFKYNIKTTKKFIILYFT